MSLPSPSSIIRFFGVDLHKHFLYIAAVNSLQQIVLKPLKIPLENWPDWARDHLLPTDVLAVESITNPWDFYDGIVSLVAAVQIANAGKLPWITKTRVKTDKHDSIKLAKLCAAGLIPQVWVPPIHIREARCLLAHRRRLVGVQTLTRNRLQSLLHRHMLELPAGEPFSNRNLPWWDSIPVSPVEKNTSSSLPGYPRPSQAPDRSAGCSNRFPQRFPGVARSHDLRPSNTRHWPNPGDDHPGRYRRYPAFRFA
jgi:hypothetical protein